MQFKTRMKSLAVYQRDTVTFTGRGILRSRARPVRSTKTPLAVVAQATLPLPRDASAMVDQAAAAVQE